MSSSQRPHRRAANSSKNLLPSGMVRDKLNADPSWQHYTNDGRWICPYCLKDLRSPKTGKLALVNHIESHLSSRCAQFKGGQGATQNSQAIYDRLLSIYIEDQARSNAAWQVFDHEGYWYSPSSLLRVPSVRIANGRFDSFTVQQMVSHLKTCANFSNGTQYTAQQVQAARDNGIRASSLANNLERVVTQSVWKYYVPQGWLCPYCTSLVPEVQQNMNAGMAHYQMATHLMQRCSVYPNDQRGIKPEASLQQVQQQYMQTSPAPVAVPIAAPVPAAAPVAAPIPAAAPVAAPIVPAAAPLAAPIPTAAPVPAAAPIAQTPPAAPVAPAAQPFDSGNSFSATPVTQHNLNTLPDNKKNHTRSGGYSTLDNDMGDIVSGFDDDDDDGLPSGSNNDWITSSTENKTLPDTPSHQDLDEYAASDALDDNPLFQEDPPVAAPVAQAAPPIENPTVNEHESEDAFGWMDDDGAAEVLHNVEANTDLIRAQGVQIGLMHDCPQIPGYTFGTRYEACSTVSGDFYEFVLRDDGHIIFAEGDVSGHGVEAGLIMSMARKCLTIFARQGGRPADVISSINEALVDDLKGEKFITMCYGELDPENREITWVRSGHNPVLCYNRYSKEFNEIKPGGMVVGMKSGKLFRQLLQEEVTQVNSGDVYLIYTDGFNETMNRQGEEYGFDRMRHVIIDKADLGVEEMLDHLMNSVRQFRGSTPADDDLTLLALAVD